MCWISLMESHLRRPCHGGPPPPWLADPPHVTDGWSIQSLCWLSILVHIYLLPPPHLSSKEAPTTKWNVAVCWPEERKWKKMWEVWEPFIVHVRFWYQLWQQFNGKETVWSLGTARVGNFSKSICLFYKLEMLGRIVSCLASPDNFWVKNNLGWKFFWALRMAWNIQKCIKKWKLEIFLEVKTNFGGEIFFFIKMKVAWNCLSCLEINGQTDNQMIWQSDK